MLWDRKVAVGSNPTPSALLASVVAAPDRSAALGRGRIGATGAASRRRGVQYEERVAACRRRWS